MHEDVMTIPDNSKPDEGAAGSPDPETQDPEPQDPGQLFEALRGQAEHGRAGRGPAPVHSWHPDRSGEIDMRIRRDGSWHYLGSPITRQPMVRLFSTILRRDDDGSFHLVTPVEKLRIQVDDAPFLAVEMAQQDAGGQSRLVFRTNVDEVVVADADHPIRVETDPDTGEPAPYLHVRDGLDALIARSVFYDLVALAEPVRIDGREVLAVRSAGSTFVLGAPQAAADRS